MKRVLIPGGSGFIGRKVCAELVARGDHVTVLTRDVARARRSLPSGVRVASWDTSGPGAWFEELEVVDAVIQLAGESVAKRWTYDVREQAVKSRVDGTRLVVEAIGKAKKKPSVLVAASATGWYGAHEPDEELDESAPAGKGFLAELVTRWESEARKVEQYGVRHAELRLGIVLGEGGGALEKMIAPFKVFAGGPIGDGTQIVPWVHVDDVVGMIVLALDNETVKGPINVTSPNPVSNAELAKAIGLVMNRPAWFRVPKAAMEIAMGDAASIITTGQRVVPKRAIELGYEFRQPRIVPALESILGHS